jgi:hypothetical protein
MPISENNNTLPDLLAVYWLLFALAQPWPDIRQRLHLDQSQSS